jgi:ATP-dependent RNA helicase DeaD
MKEYKGVAPVFTEAMISHGYENLTPVQEAIVEQKVLGADMLVSARTGSGKTVAFALAMARTLFESKDRFTSAKRPEALVITPTRELALQVKREFEWFFQPSGAIIASCVGGMDIRTERKILSQGANFVIGTPGRLVDHIKRKSFDNSDIRVVVLDEADEMLDMGFREDLEYILSACPVERQTLMFSATVPKSIASLAQKYQKNSIRLNVDDSREQHVDIEYNALTISSREQENAIINILRFHEDKSALIFCGTRTAVNHMSSRLLNRGFAVVALSGELSQNERSKAIQSMRDLKAKVCVATDVAARGIDLPSLDLVIHADIPRTSDTLLHRSGRTGRAGRKGNCIVLVSNNLRKKAERLFSGANIKVKWGTPPSRDDIIKKDDERLISNPILTQDIRDEDKATVEKLTSSFSLDQLASAYLHLSRLGQSAPEELSNVSESRKGMEYNEGLDGRRMFKKKKPSRLRDSKKHRDQDKGRSNSSEGKKQFKRNDSFKFPDKKFASSEGSSEASDYRRSPSSKFMKRDGSKSSNRNDDFKSSNKKFASSEGSQETRNERRSPSSKFMKRDGSKSSNRNDDFKSSNKKFASSEGSQETRNERRSSLSKFIKRDSSKSSNPSFAKKSPSKRTVITKDGFKKTK